MPLVLNGTTGVQDNSGAFVRATAVTVSGVAIDFTGIPSWVKRVILLFNAVSTNGSANLLIQIGSGSVTTSGYSSTSSFGGALTQASNGFVILSNNPGYFYTGTLTIDNLSGNLWVCSGAGTVPNTAPIVNSGNVTISGVLDRVRFTTTNGTDAFDSGSVNIFYQ